MFWRHWRSHTCLSDTLCTWRCLSCWRSGLCCNPDMLLRFGLRSSCLWGTWSKNAAPFHCQTRRPDTAGTIPGWEGSGSTPSGNPHMLSRWAPHSSCPWHTRDTQQVPFCSRTFRADKAGTTPGWEGPGSTHLAIHTCCRVGRRIHLALVAHSWSSASPAFVARTFRADKAGTTLDQPMLKDTLQGTSCIGRSCSSTPSGNPHMLALGTAFILPWHTCGTQQSILFQNFPGRQAGTTLAGEVLVVPHLAVHTCCRVGHRIHLALAHSWHSVSPFCCRLSGQTRSTMPAVRFW